MYAFDKRRGLRSCFGDLDWRLSAHCYKVVEVNPQHKWLLHDFNYKSALKPILVQPYRVLRGLPPVLGLPDERLEMFLQVSLKSSMGAHWAQCMIALGA